MLIGENEQRKRGRPKVADPKVSQRRAVRAYQQRQRERRAYMEQVTNAAERLKDALHQTKQPQLVLPLDLVTESTPETLNNIAAFVEAENARETGKKKRKKEGR